MSAIRSLLRTVFGKSWEICDLEIAFHKRANLYGEHGRILASHRAENIDGEPVRFVFVGLSSPPPMTPRILEYIWEEARAQGFTPHAMITYGAVLQTTPDLVPNDLVREALRNAQQGPFGAVGKTMPEKTKTHMDNQLPVRIPEGATIMPKGSKASPSEFSYHTTQPSHGSVPQGTKTQGMLDYEEETAQRMENSRVREEAQKHRGTPAGTAVM